MNLLDLMADDGASQAQPRVVEAPPERPTSPRRRNRTPDEPTTFYRDQKVRTKDGQIGEVVVYVEATQRVCVRLPNQPIPVFIHSLELEALPECPHLRWAPTVTVWPGESCERLTRTCVECGEVRGRA